MDQHFQQSIAEKLARETGANAARVVACRRLSGGAIQQNWLFDLEFDGGTHNGRVNAVLRMNSAASLAESNSRAEEFALFKTAFAEGVMVPEPLWLINYPDGDIIISRRAIGEAAGHNLVQADVNASLASELGEQLARIHSIHPPCADLDFLTLPSGSAALDQINRLRADLDKIGEYRPALEWCLRWLEIEMTESSEHVLCHGDFRTGNYMVEGGKLTAILDWEFAGWGDRMQDIGWFTAPCWRFKKIDRVAGGIGHLKDFISGYEATSGQKIVLEALNYWQVMATVRWAVIALGQAERHYSGLDKSLELALTRYLVPDLEHSALQMIQTGVMADA